MKNEKRIVKLFTWDDAEYSIVLANKFYSTIEDVMSQLVNSSFIQCHRSHIINLDYVDHISKDFFILKDGTTKIPISRFRKRASKTAYKAFIECGD